MTYSIGILTGTRADYGLLKLIIDKFHHSTNFNLFLYVTGLHLLSEYGNTKKIVQADYPDLIEVEFYKEKIPQTSEKYYINALTNGIKNMAERFRKDSIELLIVLGDRLEPLAAATASAILRIPIAHIHGGDIANDAQIDGQIRHSITKMAHLHFSSNLKSQDRILQMGEEAWRVFNVGAPGLEMILKEELLDKKVILKKLGFREDKEFILCVFHPSIASENKSGIYMRRILESLIRKEFNIIIIYPNNDPGNEMIINEIKKVQENPEIRIFKNLPRKVYLSIMKYSKFMIGNSSSGIIESAIFHLPTINIGLRNLNRDCSENVIFIGYKKSEISNAINKVTSAEFINFCKTVPNIYDGKNCSTQIFKIISKYTDKKKKLLNKKFITRKFQREA